jgi:hypothetical protein
VYHKQHKNNNNNSNNNNVLVSFGMHIRQQRMPTGKTDKSYTSTTALYVLISILKASVREPANKF